MNLNNLPLVYDAASKAGFSGAALVTAVAIAAAESGLDPNAVGDQSLVDFTWGPSIGLWQVRSLQPLFLYLEPLRDATKLPDPYYNARAAYTLSKSGTDFSPWSTFVNGAYKQFESIASSVQNPSASSAGSLLLLFVLGYFIFKK